MGDLLGSLLGLYPVLLAWRRRAPKALLARMLLNLAADAAGGAIPIVGDIWDFMFKAHARNLELLRARSVGAAGVRGHWSDRVVLALAVVAVVAAFALPVLVAVGLWHLVRARPRPLGGPGPAAACGRSWRPQDRGMIQIKRTYEPAARTDGHASWSSGCGRAGSRRRSSPRTG